MNRRTSVEPTPIHVNPNRPKTPTAAPKVRTPVDDVFSPNILADLYQANQSISSSSVSVDPSGRESETIFIKFADNSRGTTPGSGSGVSLSDLGEKSPLLGNTNEAGDPKHLPVDEDDTGEPSLPFFHKKNRKTLIKQLKVFVLIALTAVCSIFVIFQNEEHEDWYQISVESSKPKGQLLKSKELE